jgi:hypothetical protein
MQRTRQTLPNLAKPQQSTVKNVHGVPNSNPILLLSPAQQFIWDNALRAGPLPQGLHQPQRLPTSSSIPSRRRGYPPNPSAVPTARTPIFTTSQALVSKPAILATAANNHWGDRCRGRAAGGVHRRVLCAPAPRAEGLAPASAPVGGSQRSSKQCGYPGCMRVQVMQLRDSTCAIATCFQSTILEVIHPRTAHAHR